MMREEFKERVRECIDKLEVNSKIDEACAGKKKKKLFACNTKKKKLAMTNPDEENTEEDNEDEALMACNTKKKGKKLAMTNPDPYEDDGKKMFKPGEEKTCSCGAVIKDGKSKCAKCIKPKVKAFIESYNGDFYAGMNEERKPEPVINVKVKKELGYGKIVKGSEELNKKDKPSFMPSTPNRLTHMEGKHGVVRKEGQQAENDAELFADAVCQKKGYEMNSGKWKYFKTLYLKSFDEGPDALKKLKKNYITK